MKAEDYVREDVIEELVEYIAGQRKAQEKYWWVGQYDPDGGDPMVVSVSLRGFLEDNMWLPLEYEIGADCCSELVTRSKAQNLEDSFEFMRHCMTKEHIKEMLEQKRDDQLQAEYTYMLEQVMESLTENF